MKKKLKVFVITLLIVLTVGFSFVYYRVNQEMARMDAEAARSEVASGNTVTAPEGELLSGNALPGEVVSENETVLSENESPEPEPNTRVINTAQENRVVISFAGDILFDPYYAIYATYLQRESVLEECISPELLALMKQADIMMVNNEFPYSDGGAPQADKMYTFRADPESVNVLFDMGVDIVSIANNHTFDYGEEAFLDTLTTLEEAGMPYVGAGRNLEEAARPFYFEADGVRIGILAATQIERTDYPNTRGATEELPGVLRCWNPDYLVETIRETKENCDFLILFIHWGTESTDVLDWAQVDQAPLYAEAGADLIIGAHPHVLQEIGYEGEVPVVYSLGNFWFNSRTLDSALVTVTLQNGELESLQFVPCLQTGCGVELLHGADRDRVLNYMRGISSEAVIDENGYVVPAAGNG